MMRVISGKYRGRKIETLNSKGLRPTMGRAREAVFNILAHGKFSENSGDVVVGSNVLDLFCGCGALAIEALSRGSSQAILVDVNQNHLDVARNNIINLGEDKNTVFLRADSSNPPPAKLQCDLVFVDPPYGQKLADKSLENLIKRGWLAIGAVIVVETGKHEDVKVSEEFEEFYDRNYGNSRIRIYQWNPERA